jgi:hypothetical protein
VVLHYFLRILSALYFFCCKHLFLLVITGSGRELEYLNMGYEIKNNGGISPAI